MAIPETVPAEVRAVPLAGVTALGLGPLVRPSSGPVQLTSFFRSPRGRLLAVETAGNLGRQLVLVIHAAGGQLTPERLRFHTAGADAAVIQAEVERLVAADLASVTADGTIHLTPGLVDILGPPGLSMGAHQALSSDELARICRHLHIEVPKRKPERIAAVAAHFADPETARLVLKGLSRPARDLLDRIYEEAGGPVAVAGSRLGLDYMDFYVLGRTRYTHRPAHFGSVKPLEELASVGLVGASEWEKTVWVWLEAVPALDRPQFSRWQAPEPAPLVPVASSPPQLPPVVAAADRALAHWAHSPPPTLKSDEPRLAKAAASATAKAIGALPAAADLIARLVIDIGLLEPMVATVSGRGRNRKVDRVWTAVPERLAAWQQLDPVGRWARLVAAWCRPGHADHAQQLLCNRHLVLWELGCLEPGLGYQGDDAFAAWIEGRYSTLGLTEAVLEVLADLRLLGLAPTSGPLLLTPLARHLLVSPATVTDALGQSSTSVVVQGDLTILVPPDIEPTIEHRLSSLAREESSGAARVLRLDEDRITRAVQAGSTADDIVAFLRQVSSVPLADAVTRLVTDAAARAERVTLVSATTVVVVNDPTDLLLVCSVKAARLQPVSDTVAVSALPLDKVHAALDRKGLAPAVAGRGTATEADASSGGSRGRGHSADPAPSGDRLEAARLRTRVDELRALAKRSGSEFLHHQADHLAQQAELLADPRRRLTVEGPLALLPETAASLGAARLARSGKTQGRGA